MAGSHAADQIYIVVVGDGSVGKSSIVSRYIDGSFAPKYDPTIEDSFTKQVPTGDGQLQMVTIMDTSGQEEFFPLIDLSIQSADCAIVVFDLCNISSFIAVPKYVSRISTIYSASPECFPRALVGNKSDQQPECITDALAEKQAEELHLRYFKTSAKLNDNISAVFDYLIECVQAFRNSLPYKRCRCNLL